MGIGFLSFRLRRNLFKRNHQLHIGFLIFIIMLSVFLFSGCEKKLHRGTVSRKYKIDLSFDPTVDQQRKLAIYQTNAKSGRLPQIFELALQYARMGFFNKADIIFERAAKSSPKNVEFLLAVGEYFEKYRRDPDRAIEYYRKASELETKLRDDAFYRQGFVYLRINQPDKASKIWERGSKSAKNLNEWLFCIQDLAKLHRTECMEHILVNLMKNFPDSTRPLKTMLNYGIGDSEKIIDKIYNLNPFDKVLDDYSRVYFLGKSLGDVIEISNNSNEFEKVLAGHFIIDNCENMDTIKYGISALNGFANSPHRKIEFMKYLSSQGLYKYAYEVAVVSYSMTKSKTDKAKMRLFALDLLAQMDNLGIDAPCPKLFGGDEPDLFGGAISVLTDRYNVANFVRALRSAENKFYVQYRCQNLLKKFIGQNPDDSLKLQAYMALEKIARKHLDYARQIEYLRLELELTKNLDDRMRIYFRIMDAYDSEKSYSKMFVIADEMFDKFAPDSGFASKMPDIEWKLERANENSARKFAGKYFHKWFNNMGNGDVALENFLAISKTYYNLLSKNDRQYFIEQYLQKILDYAPTDEFWSYIALNNAKSLDKLQNLYIKYPFVSQYLKKYADAIMKSKELPELCDVYMDSALADTEDIPLNLLAAELQYRVSHFKQAYKLYRRVLTAKPGWRFLILRVGELAHSLGDTAVAIDLYKKIITLEPDSRDYVERLGDILEQWHKNTKQIWNMLIYDEPLESDNWGELAAVQWDYFRYDEGVQTIYDARKFFGDENLFAKELAALFDWQGKYDNAFEEYISALKSTDAYDTDEIANWLKRLFKHSGKPKKLLPELAKYVDSKSQSSAILTVFCSLALENNDTAFVIKKLSDLAENSKSPDVLNEVIRYANILKKTGIVVDANIRKAEIEGSYYPMVNASFLLADNGDIKRAIKIFNDLVSKKSEYRQQFARFLIKYKKYSNAATIYRQLIADDSLNCDNYLGLCDAYIEMGKSKEARKMLTDAIEMFKNIDTQKYRYHIKQLRIALAKTYRNSEPNEALAAYERLTNKYPLDKNILRDVWLFARDKNLVSELIKYYEDVASKAPKNYRWDMLLWRLNRWQHRMNSARRWLAKACDNEPQRADIWRLRYNIAFVMQDFDDARKSLDQLEKLGLDIEEQKVEYYLATGMEDSAYLLISKSIRKVHLSGYEYSNIISDLIQRGMFQYGEDVIGLWRNENNRGYDREKYWDYEDKIAELNEKPDEARRLIQEKLNWYLRNYHNNDWEISDAIAKYSDLARRWHYLEDAIKSAKSNSHSYWNDKLLEKLYTYGGDVISLAKLFVAMNENDDAIELLYKSGEYDELAKICWDVDINSPDVSIDTKIACAIARWHTGEQESARRILNSLPEFEAGNPYLFAKISRAYLMLGEPENAEKFANLAISSQKYPDARIAQLLIDVKLARGDTSSAVKILTDIPTREKIPEIWRIEKLFKIGRDKIALRLLRKRWEYNDKNDNYYYYEYGGSESDVLIRFKKYDILVDRLIQQAENSEDDWRRNDLILEAATDILNAEPQRAAEIIGRYFGENPDNNRAKLILGEALCKSRKFRRAIEILEGIHSSDAMKILANAYYGIGDSTSANDIILTFLENNRDETSFANILDMLIENEQYELASRIGNLALQIWGGIPEIWLKSGIAFVKSGNTDKGFQLVKKSAFQHYDENISDDALDFWAKESAKNNPQSTLDWARSRYLDENIPLHRKFDLRVLSAKILWESGRKQDAIDEAKQITVLFPNERDGFILLEKFYRDADIIEKANEVKKTIDTHFDFKSNNYY